MKKRLLTLLVLLSLLSLLSSCSSKNSSINVYTLNGTTGFGLSKMIHDNKSEDSNYKFSVESDVSIVSAALINKDADIACLPTNAAANLYNKTKGNIQVLAINTKGCLYLLNSGSSDINSFGDLEGKTVYAPSQNPTFILQYIASSYNTNINIDNTYSSASDLKDALASGIVEYAILPEPMVTIATNAAKKINITIKNELDLTSLWNNIEGKNDTLVQGCVIARKDFIDNNKKLINKFLKEYKESINYLTIDIDNASKYIVESNIFTNENIAKSAIPKCNICYIDKEEMKESMNTYLNVLYEISPSSIGNCLPDDNFYYI